MTLALQLFKNSIKTKEKLRLNLHSLSVSELLEYGRNARIQKFTRTQRVEVQSELPLRVNAVFE